MEILKPLSLEEALQNFGGVLTEEALAAAGFDRSFGPYEYDRLVAAISRYNKHVSADKRLVRVGPGSQDQNIFPVYALSG